MKTINVKNIDVLNSMTFRFEMKYLRAQPRGSYGKNRNATGSRRG